MPHIKTNDDVKWYYEVAGQGEPVLFIHGWGVNMRIWKQQAKNLSKKFSVILIDLPGHGQSSWKKIDLHNIAVDINFIIEKLGYSKINIVACSLGGLIALKMFELFPDKIKRLVLVGSQARFVWADDYPFGLKIERIEKLSGQIREHYPSMINIFFRSLFTKEERKSRRFKWIQTFRQRDSYPNQEALLDLLVILSKEDLRDTLKKANFPLQFIYGDDDYICPKGLHKLLEEQFPAARFNYFEKCGHFPFLSKPYEFNKVLNEFLES